MTEPPPSQDLFNRYLNIIGVSQRDLSLEALSELVSAHLMSIPFENISKLYYKKHLGLHGLLDFKQYLDGIEDFHFGGTCYTNNYYFHLLLAHLGYEIKLCGADMNNPDVHIVSIVKVDGHEYIVDVGYAAPFMQPLPRDLDEDFEILLGRDRYLLKPQDSEGRSRLEMYRDGQLRHSYTAKPTPRQIDYFADAIAHSFTGEATFMNALLLVRFFPNRSLRINNLDIIESEGAESRTRQLKDRKEVIRAVVEHFSIPEDIVAEALSNLDLTGDAWN